MDQKLSSQSQPLFYEMESSGQRSDASDGDAYLPDIEENISGTSDTGAEAINSSGQNAYKRKKALSLFQRKSSGSESSPLSNITPAIIVASRQQGTASASEDNDSSGVVTLSSDSEDDTVSAKQRKHALESSAYTDCGTYQNFAVRCLDEKGFLKLVSGMQRLLSRVSPEALSCTLQNMDSQVWGKEFLGFRSYDKGILHEYWNSVLANRLKMDSEKMLAPIVGGMGTEDVAKLRRLATVYLDSVHSKQTHLPPMYKCAKSVTSSISGKFPSTALILQGNITSASTSAASSSSENGSSPKEGNTFPKSYPKKGNSDVLCHTQRHFCAREDLHIAKSITQLSDELFHAGSSGTGILDYILSDSWTFDTPNHRCLKDRVNELNVTAGLEGRSGAALKERWDFLVKCISSGNTELPFLLDATVDSAHFKCIVSEYQIVATNNLQCSQSCSNN